MSGRLMAIDYGEKRTGIAVTDELQLIASGLTTVETKNLFSFLKKYFQKEKIKWFIIGLPRDLNNKESVIEKQIYLFIKQFKKQFPSIEIVRQDERFTSKIAVKTMIDSGLKKKKRREKAIIDEISATLILQSFMERKIFIEKMNHKNAAR